MWVTQGCLLPLSVKICEALDRVGLLHLLEDCMGDD